MQLVPEAHDAFVEIDVTAEFKIRLYDRSTDPLTTAGAVSHTTSLRREYDAGQDTIGWSVQVTPAFVTTKGGEFQDVSIRVRANQFVREPVLDFKIVARMGTPDGEIERVVNLTAVTFGPKSFIARAPPPLQLGPGDIDNTYLAINNGGLLERGYDIQVSDNPCGLTVAVGSNNLVPAKTTKQVPISVLAPGDKLWYNAEACRLGFLVSPNDAPSNTFATAITVIITGVYIDPIWVFTGLGLFFAVALLLIVLARRKSRIEEEILGRPQKPWHIPVERVYLEHLKERDPQAHYVVRHFLMEEEYQSSLLWYKEFKHATRGSRAKERLVVGQEHRYEKFRAGWEKAIARPAKKADRFEARMQKKLDRRGKKGHRDDVRKWKKLTKKMQAAHEKKVEKALAKWEKQVKKAEKKEQPVPEKPEVPEPAYPPEPKPGRALVADHPRFFKKVQKCRAKAVKQQGDLEVKFEKADAKMLRKVKKKVLKIARKLDDEEFAESHPLLRDSAAE